LNYAETRRCLSNSPLDSKLSVVPSQIVNEQFLNPRNVGSIDNPEGLGEASSLACGALVRITLRINADKNITDARFKAIGCRLLIASASLLTEEIKGKTTADAAQIARSESPNQCTAMCRDAVLSAITHYSDTMREEWVGEEALICTCFGVSEHTIEGAIQTGGLLTIAEVTKCSNAGAGCGSCCPLIQDMLDVYWREQRIRNRELCI
jgi:NifU-like protein